jgi:hypothetical protein
MSRSIRSVLFATVASLLIATPVLAAEWPRSVVGIWGIQANQSPGTLEIVTQDRGEGCVRITGTIYNTNVIEGFYCPSTGRISFLRKTTRNVSFQVFTGNLSQRIPGRRLWIGGTFASEDYNLGGNLGEYSFLAKNR